MIDTIQGSSDPVSASDLEADINEDDSLENDGAVDPESRRSPSYSQGSEDRIATYTSERHSFQSPNYQARVGTCSYLTVNFGKYTYRCYNNAATITTETSCLVEYEDWVRRMDI
jgi:hypothetical protein